MTSRALLRVETRTGAAVAALLPELQRLRVQVFRAWPYLYDGKETAESSYSGVYTTSAAAALVVALDGERCIGTSTCLPLEDETANVVAPFLARGWDPARFFYFGESVLLPGYRGQGIGGQFFAHREAHARRASAADYACFCAVERPADHPARPADHADLAPFWRRRGYAPLDGVACSMDWKEVGQDAATSHRMQFWAKALHEAPLP